MDFPRVRLTPPSAYSPRSLTALAVSALLGTTACQPELGEAPPAGPSPVQARELRVANSLTTQALVFNALTTNAQAIPLLIGNGLVPLFSGVSANPYLQQQLKDPAAREVMPYLVSCALPVGTQVSWTDPTTGLPGTPWEGKLGLCPQWKTGAPSPACLNWVSACLLARNNAQGRRVELSLRGQDPSRPTLFSTESVTRPVLYHPATDAAVPSYAACLFPDATEGRDCGWRPEGLGRCVPGAAVRLGAGARAPDQCGTGGLLGTTAGARMMLRVCDDIAGCDAGDARKLASSEGACATTSPSVTFTCPASGFFNVMSAPYSSTQSGSVAVQVETGTGAATRYPLSETDTFFLREGAYYGNIFDAEALATTVYVDRDGKVRRGEEIVDGAVYRKMYSCQAAGWSGSAAYATHRLCALPGSGANCAATSVGLCVNPKEPRTSHCQYDDGPLVKGDGDFEICTDTGGNKWMEPITVFLHNACSALPGAPGDVCQAR